MNIINIVIEFISILTFIYKRKFNLLIKSICFLFYFIIFLTKSKVPLFKNVMNKNIIKCRKGHNRHQFYKETIPEPLKSTTCFLSKSHSFNKRN